MKKLIALALVLMTVFTLMIPVFASADGSQVTMWVNTADGKNLNVRPAPSTHNKLLYRLTPGTRVLVDTTVDTPRGWAFITSEKHPEGGYVMTEFLVSRQPGKYEITEREDNFRAVTPYTVSAKARSHQNDSVGLRVSPNKTARMIRRLNIGDRLQVIAVGRVWSRVIDLATGQTGYMANDYMIRL